jgi:transposase-like protein
MTDAKDGGVAVAMLQPAEARVVEPVQDRAALENARLLNQARAALLRSGTAVTIDAIAEVTGKAPATVRRWVSRLRNDRRLATVSHDGQVYIPSFQLSPAFDDVDPHAAEIVGQLVAYGMDGWSVWDWFLTANTWLGGDTPVARLADGDSDALGRAVSGLRQE